jgi:hypothetical protein
MNSILDDGIKDRLHATIVNGFRRPMSVSTQVGRISKQDRRRQDHASPREEMARQLQAPINRPVTNQDSSISLLDAPTIAKPQAKDRRSLSIPIGDPRRCKHV